MTTILVTGGNRGIGLEFVTQFLKLGFSVITTSRKTSKSIELLDLKDHFNNSLEILELDLLSDESIEKFGALLGSRPIDIFVNNAGVMGPRNLELNQVSSTPWLEVLRVNTIAPLILTKNILPNILSGDEKKMFYLSSRVGSIAENTAGAMYAYRSSKAALNRVMRSFACDVIDREIIVSVFHPGWVKTDMGGTSADIDVMTSVAGMRDTIAGLVPSDSGKFFNYDGSSLLW